MGSYALLALLCTRLHAPAASTVLEPSASAEPDAAPDTLSIEAVGALFQRGQDRFETSDFAAAIELWTRAYEGLPDDPQLAATRALLMANIAQAHVEAHAMDGQIDHLRHADRLFEQYAATIDPGDTQTLASVQTHRQRIAEMLARHEAELAAAREAARAADEESRGEDRRDPAPAIAAPPAAVPAPVRWRRGGPRYNKGERAMVIGGGVTVAFGVGTIGALATFLWLRDEAQRDGEQAARDPSTTSAELRSKRRSATRFDSLAISTGAAAGVLTVVGLAVIAAAEIHRAKRTRLQVGASTAPGAFGVLVRGRF